MDESNNEIKPGARGGEPLNGKGSWTTKREGEQEQTIEQNDKKTILLLRQLC